ncbi:hypothetical protein AAIH55_36700, partial [Pseudomonas aeruginosa]
VEVQVEPEPATAARRALDPQFTARQVDLAIACLLVLLLGALMGTLAGVLRGVFNVPSFVATLGLWSALRGMGLFMTNALPVPINENEVLDWLGGQFLGVPVYA